MYGPMLMAGFLAPSFPHIHISWLIFGGAFWAIVWRVFIRKHISAFDDPDSLR